MAQKGPRPLEENGFPGRAFAEEKIGALLDSLLFKRVSYGDIRFVRMRKRILSAKNGAPSAMDERESSGIGVRVLVNGAWGFSATDTFGKEDLERAVRQAVATAKASALLRNKPVKLIPRFPAQAQWRTETEIDPWTVSPSGIMARLLACEKILRKDTRVRVTESAVEFIRKEQIFASTDGAMIFSIRNITGGGISCKAFGTHEIQSRSYPSASRNYQNAGFEAIRGLCLEENAERIREEAVLLLKSPPCPSRTFDLILKGSILALQIHESIGHAAELDRIFGFEDSFGGGTFLGLRALGRMRLGARAVTVIANRPEDKKGAGFVTYDDEGVPAKETVIVDRGLFKDYLSSRETAFSAGFPASSGSAISEDWTSFPLVRMTALSLLPGKIPFDQMLKEIKDGLLLSEESSWSIDERRNDFQIGGEIAWRVRNGKIASAFKNPLYRARTSEFWRRCAGIADRNAYEVFSFADCGKGGPLQNAYVSHGSSPAWFREIPCYPSKS